jgi:hypothetical protein
MAISKRLRYEILRRDGNKCRYCGLTAADTALTIDHVVPSALGGGDEPSNLVAACGECNSGKSASSTDAALVEDVSQDALRWAAAMEMATRRAYARRTFRLADRENFEGLWNNWTYESKGERQNVPLPSEWGVTIDRFVEAGLNGGDFEDAIEIAMLSRATDTFRYMCGVLWKRVNQRVEDAQQLLAEEDAQKAREKAKPDRSHLPELRPDVAQRGAEACRAELKNGGESGT